MDERATTMPTQVERLCERAPGDALTGIYLHDSTARFSSMMPPRLGERTGA